MSLVSAHAIVPACLRYSRQPKQLFKDYACLSSFKFQRVKKNGTNQLNMQIKLSHDIYDFEGHNP